MSSTTKSENRELSKLIEQHLPLVKHIVFQVAVHFPRHVDRDDLARAGALGLVEAARRYDGARGVPFDRFAAQRIRGRSSTRSVPPTGHRGRCGRSPASSRGSSSVSPPSWAGFRTGRRWPKPWA